MHDDVNGAMKQLLKAPSWRRRRNQWRVKETHGNGVGERRKIQQHRRGGLEDVKSVKGHHNL